MAETVVMTLTEFLLARIAEDEAAARAAINPERPGTHWHWVNNDDDTPAVFDGEYRAIDLRTVEEFPTTSGVGDLPAFIITYAEADIEDFSPLPHIARHDPARVLAECEAKRRIMALYRGATGANYSQRRGEHETAKAALLALASVYSDHPDYDEAWRP